MAETAKINVKLGLTSKDFNKGLKTSMIQLAALKKVAEFAGQGIRAMGRGMIGAAQAASDVSETLNLMGLVFEGSTQDVLDWSVGFAEATGRSRYELQSMATQMQAVLSPMMGSAEAATGLSQSMTQLAIDVASAANLDEQMALDKLKAGLIGEAEPMKSLGVVMTQASLAAFALGQGITTSMKDMTEAEKVSLRYAFIQEKLGHMAGDAANTSEGYANRLRTLSSIKKDLFVVIGQSLMPVFSMMLGKLIELGNWMLANKATIQSWIKTGWMVLFSVIDSLLAQVEFFTKVWDVLKIAGTLAINGLLTVLRSLVEMLYAVLSPFNLLGAALSKLTGAANPIQGAFDAAFGAIDSGIENTALKAHDLIGTFGETGEAVQSFRAGVVGFGEDAVHALNATTEAAVAVVEPLKEVEAVNVANEDARKEREAEIAEAWEKEKSIFEERMQKAEAAGEKIGEIFLAMGEGQKAMEKVMKGVLSNSLDMLKDYIIKSITMRASGGGAAAGEAVAGIPVVGPALAVIAVAATFALIKGLISKMHAGGAVTKGNLLRLPGQSSDEGVAVLQEGEYVTPRGGGGGGGINVQYNAVFPQTRVEVDTFVSEMLVPALRRREAAGGD
jgi:hypothetical protein